MADQDILTVNLMDESFNPHNTADYGLAIVLNESALSCCVLDFRRNKFLGLNRYARNDLKLQEGQAQVSQLFGDFLNTAFTAMPWLGNSFKLVKIAYDGRKTTLVPASLFDENEKEQYFNFNFAREKDELIRCDHLMSLDAWQVFSLPGSVQQTVMSAFPRCKVIHASSLFIESVWINYKNRINSPHVFLHVRDHLFDLMIFDGRQMTYFNTFPFQNAEDVTYYLVFVLEQLNLNPETIPLVLLGDVDATVGLSELLHRYIRHVERGRRNEAYRYSYILNQLPPQSNFPLLNFFSCGL